MKNAITVCPLNARNKRVNRQRQSIQEFKHCLTLTRLPVEQASKQLLPPLPANSMCYSLKEHMSNVSSMVDRKLTEFIYLTSSCMVILVATCHKSPLLPVPSV